jgi:hypothetical protein
MTALVDGTTGLREFLGRLLKWRVGAGSYPAALLIAPLLMFAVLLTLSMFSPQFLPGILVSDDRRALVLSGMAIAVAAGTVEELGWTGFAIPRLRRQHGAFPTAAREAGCIKPALACRFDPRSSDEETSGHHRHGLGWVQRCDIHTALWRRR